MTLTQFLVAHRACLEGHKRAKEFTSLEDAWQNCLPRDLVWAATRPGVLTEKELRLFAVFCARSVQHLMTDPRSRNAVEVAERYVQGKATRKELSAASRDARAAYNASSAFTAADDAADDADDAADAAAAAAAYAADAASSSTADAADTAATAASFAASASLAAASAYTDAEPFIRYGHAAVAAAAAAAARRQQAAWLRQNTTPNFN